MRSKYIIRLDDYCNTSNRKNWDRIEKILDNYDIKPIIAIIPDNKDNSLFFDENKKDFWKEVEKKYKKDWIIAQHGYQHLYTSKNSGIMKLNNYSEFAGLDFSEQYKKIKKGYNFFLKHKIEPEIFISPAHSMDFNTLKALKKGTNIRIISDGFSLLPYKKDDFLYIPQQLWNFRKLPVGIWTICLHPDFMNDNDFKKMRSFLDNYYNFFINPKDLYNIERKIGLFDKTFNRIYRIIRGIKNVIK